MRDMPLQALERYIARHPKVRRYCIAYSGGVDSHVLLDVAARLLAGHEFVMLRAIHINHGLQEQADQWAEHCQRVCNASHVPLTIRRVAVPDGKGDGPEANARLVRYAAFSEHLLPDEHLLLAQHADDQAETFLLQALRGSGPDGLASIPLKRPFADGTLARPLLGCLQSDITDYAEHHSLDWIDDTSNRDTRFDRNFLRENIMPLLRERWPSMAHTLSRSAQRSAAASQTLLGLADQDLAEVQLAGRDELSIAELRTLPRERAYNALRLWVRQHGKRLPRLQDLVEVWRTLIMAGEETSGLVKLPGYEFRRYRDALHFVSRQSDAAPSTEAFLHEWHAPFEPLDIPETGQQLTASACADFGLELPDSGIITVRSRKGGELIKIGDPAYRKPVKKLLQEAAVPPWQREAIPLLYIDDRLAAVWGVAVSVDFRKASSHQTA